ncbi:WYL domain-containing protein [uncultured Bacteroides sp.]|uniref:WYL domain-containing protein n=1 Tax=uncultured Bacteroides sp. TaxID=162156 RepID=UPI0025CE63D9|nr:WYL domain-containing protein [uncultured Bacteroides sp.]
MIDTLSSQPLTLPEIQKKWMNASANEDGEPLAVRSFGRYRRLAESLMYVDIDCDKSTNLYRVIRPESFKNRDLQEWLLSAFRISCLAERVNQHEEVMIEPAPPAAGLLQEVMDAIDKEYPLRFVYKSHYQEEKSIELIPAFVRLFKQRWYLIGEVKGKGHPMTCALERMKQVETLEGKKIKISPKLRKTLKPETYFEHCFGIIRQFEPITIRFRAFWPQDAYIKDVPLHSSQVEVAHTEDYTDFEIFVRPTYDLKQELLWHRDKLAVLSPESFRQDMISVLRATLGGYETGVGHAIDE